MFFIQHKRFSLENFHLNILVEALTIEGIFFDKKSIMKHLKDKD